MMRFDNKNNNIEVCLFESYLAKYFLENPELFRNLTQKIIAAIERLIELNSDNKGFDRELYAVFTLVSKVHPGITDINALKRSTSLIVFDTFFKFFTENIIMALPFLKQSPLGQHSLFASAKIMRPDRLFSEENRGVIELDDVDEETSCNFGILSIEDTPKDLHNFFEHKHFPSRQLYMPKEDSLMAQWLRERHLPVISGASGGVGKTLSSLSNLVLLSKKECLLLGLLIASSTIALGHHSFFEVMFPLSFHTGELEDKPSLLEYYEQVIPEEIRCLESYKEHIRNTGGFIVGLPIIMDELNYSFKRLYLSLSDKEDVSKSLHNA